MRELPVEYIKKLAIRHMQISQELMSPKMPSEQRMITNRMKGYIREIQKYPEINLNAIQININEIITLDRKAKEILSRKKDSHLEEASAEFNQNLPLLYAAAISGDNELISFLKDKTQFDLSGEYTLEKAIDALENIQVTLTHTKTQLIEKQSVVSPKKARDLEPKIAQLICAERKIQTVINTLKIMRKKPEETEIRETAITARESCDGNVDAQTVDIAGAEIKTAAPAVPVPSSVSGAGASDPGMGGG